MVGLDNIKVDDKGPLGKADPPSASQPMRGLLSSTSTGYVRIYRSLWEKGYWWDSEYVHLWVHLIMKATYRPKEYLFNGKIEYLQPGQFIAGRRSLSKETGIQESKIERILYCFATEHQIEQQTTNKFRIITILNWNKYQTDEQQNEQQMNNQRTTSEHKQERKERKERTYTAEFEIFWGAYPNKKAKIEAFKAWVSVNGKRPEISFILEAIKKQKASPVWIKDGGQFIPHPSTWLRAGRWDDETEILKQKGLW